MDSGLSRNKKPPGRPATKPRLSITHPLLANEAVDWNPEEFTAGVNTKFRWCCSKGHQYDASPNSRSNGTGCPFCAGRKVLVGFNDLATTNPELAEQVVGADPRTITAGSGKRLTWACSHGHTWTAPPNGRRRGEGCPVCAGRSVAVGSNDLATTNPDLAAQATGWDPTTLSAGSNHRVAVDADRDMSGRLHRTVVRAGGAVPTAPVSRCFRVTTTWQPPTQILRPRLMAGIQQLLSRAVANVSAGDAPRVTFGGREAQTGSRVRVAHIARIRKYSSGSTTWRRLIPSLPKKLTAGTQPPLSRAEDRGMHGVVASVITGGRPLAIERPAMDVLCAQTNWSLRAITIWPLPILTSP